MAMSKTGLLASTVSRGRPAQLTGPTASPADVRGEPVIRRRSMALQAALFVATLGMYAIYWFYVTSKEMVEYRDLDGDPGVWTLMFPLPLANVYSIWQHAGAVEALTGGKYGRGPVFLAWLVPPVAWFITQRQLNARSTD